MDGFLDHLEINGGAFSLQHKKNWVRRFFKLNEAFHILEFFTDASMRQRKGKIDLQDAQVATADELGELLALQSDKKQSLKISSKISIENSRRFVIRVTEASSSSTKKQHYLCADIPQETTGNDASACRKYMQQWLQALHSVTNREDVCTTPTSFIDLRELNGKIFAYMNQLHLSAAVSGREKDSNGKGSYEITIKAWILQRELVPDDNSSETSDSVDNDRGKNSSWQILEYSCAWKIQKSTMQLRDFDSQLRQFFREELRDLVFPSVSSSSASKINAILHPHSPQLVGAENQRRVAKYDAYMQQLLCLPAFSAFGSDASAMLDHFLEISPHLAPLRQIEKEMGQQFHLRNRKIVPWLERIKFETLYKAHLELIAARGEARMRDPYASSSRVISERSRPRKSEHQRHERAHQRQHHHHRESKHGDTASEQDPVKPLPEQPCIPIEDVREGESVHDRIAKIGHKLLAEAFLVPSPSAI